MSASWGKRGPGRFEVRVYVPATDGPGTRSTYSRTSKLEIALMGMSEIVRQWANVHGAVKPRVTVDVVDTNDGGIVAQLKFLGFETGTMDAALNTLRTNGFPDIREVASG